MGKQYAEGLTELDITKAKGLEYHLQGNFYPPHPRYVVDDIINAFKKFWKDRREGEYKITLEQLANECHLTSVDGLIHYFEPFINWEDEEDLR